MSVAFRVDVEIADAPVDGVYPARVRQLGIATFGDSPDDAIDQLQDALESYMRSLLEHNELVSEFERLGVEFKIERVRTREMHAHVEITDNAATHRPARGHALVPAL